MTLQAGDPVRLTAKHAAVRSGRPKARKDWADRVGVIKHFRRHSKCAYVIWGNNRGVEQEQICVLEKIDDIRRPNDLEIVSQT